MELIGDHLTTVKVEELDTSNSTWSQPGQERTSEGCGDTKIGNMEGDQMQATNTGGGDGFVYEEEIIMNQSFPPGDGTGNVSNVNADEAAKEVPNMPDADKMYQEMYDEQKKKDEEEQSAVLRQREDEVRLLKKQIADEMRKKAQRQAAEALRRHKAAEQAAHDKYLNDLKLQLATLQNPETQSSAHANTQQRQVHTATPQGSLSGSNVANFGASSAHHSLSQPGLRHISTVDMQGGTPVSTSLMQGNQGQAFQLQGLQSNNPPPQTFTPLYVPATRPQVHTPQKNISHLMPPTSSNRRSPRANVSSLAFDAARKQEAPMVSSRPASATGTPLMQQSTSTGFFYPVASSSPAKGDGSSIPGMLSPRSRKRAPTVTGQVLEQFLDRKKSRKQGMATQSPSAKGPKSVPTDDLRSLSERKYNLAKALDGVLKETLKQGNINKIKKQVDDAGFQAIPVPEPMPKDLFCYCVSMYMMEIGEQEPNARAALVRKNCLDYIVSQMFNFAEVS